ncbi:hypothetical protein [Enterococcus villorum]
MDVKMFDKGVIPLRPKTKEELLEAATLRFDELWNLIDSSL